jgi:hypothetical protein
VPRWLAIALPGKRCLATLLLFLLALGGADVRAVVVPLNDFTAAEAALRFVVREGNEIVPGGWVACVELSAKSGELPTKLIESLLAENPNLRPVAACRVRQWRLYVSGSEKPVPYVGCYTRDNDWLTLPSPGRTPSSAGTVKITCHIHHGPLDGIGSDLT